ncbi:MAG: ImmA/IrrE family metallo-endopeptidase [Planctomycetes bacterium]|nr:ImmA/IrrE family metallo-endopeptidase [Planctomycetota bacterium]
MLEPTVTHAADRLLALGRITRPPVPVDRLAKLAGAEVRTGPLPPDLSGFLLRQGGKPIVGVNSTHAPVRQRFTIAHELGHLSLHPDKSYVDRGFAIYFRDDKSASAEDRAEIQANQFAADLLMPRRMLEAALKGWTVDIEDEVTLRRIAERFDVSTQALTYRLINLGFASGMPSPSRRQAGADRHET